MANISGNGGYVVFASSANNLVPNDIVGNCGGGHIAAQVANCIDVFVHDRASGGTELVSVASDESQANENSTGSAISGDGRFVTFESHASNLASGDANGVSDIFVRDRLLGLTQRASVNSGGTGGDFWSVDPDISEDGRFIAFVSAASNLVPADSICFPYETPGSCPDIFVWDRLTQTTERVSLTSSGSEGNGRSGGRPSLSSDARFVAFTSEASNLVSGDSNGFPDVFIRDRLTEITDRVSEASDGTQGVYASYGPSISAEGRFVVFASDAFNLVPGTSTGQRVYIHALSDSDSDDEWDPFDPCPANPDCDADGIIDGIEVPCGSDAANPASLPERIDTPGDDDGDTVANEAPPPGAEAYDCDGDGFIGSAEASVATSDQDPCGSNGWPADLAGDDNRLNIGDLNSFLFPQRLDGSFNKFDHPLDDDGNTVVDVAMMRWNLEALPGITRPRGSTLVTSMPSTPPSSRRRRGRRCSGGSRRSSRTAACARTRRSWVI